MREETKKADAYFHFVCPHGHENRIAAESDGQYERMARGELAVRCSSCSWESQAFRPALFQQLVPGDLLIWVCTTRKAEEIQARLDIRLAGAPIFPYPAPASPSPASPDGACRTSSEPAPPDSPQEAAQPEALDGVSAEPTESPQIREIEIGDRGRIGSLPSGAGISVGLAGLKTQRIEKTDLSPRIDAPPPRSESPWDTAEISVADTVPRSGSPRDTAEISVADTVEIPAPSPGVGRRERNFGDSLRKALNALLALSTPAILIAVLVVLASLSRRIVRIETAALASPALLPPQTSAVDSTRVPESPVEESPPLEKAPESPTPEEWRRLAASNEELAEKCRALDIGYQRESRAKKELERHLEESTESRRQLAERCAQLENSQKQGDAALSSLAQKKAAAEQEAAKARADARQAREIGQKSLDENARLRKNSEAWSEILASEMQVECLWTAEKDFFEPMDSRSGDFFLFYDDGPAKGPARKSLRVALLGADGRTNFEDLFETQPLGAQKEIPFVYSWDGRENAAILTRIQGVNTVHHVRFQVQDGRVRSNRARSFFSTSYPEVLGPPSVSPDGERVAWVRKEEDGLRVEVYHLARAEREFREKGGGDTSRAPAWSPDGKVVFWVAEDRQGIRAMPLSGQPRSLNLKNEVYGRYMSCSPDGKKLAFFQKSEEGKGKVHLCLWSWADGSVAPVQESVWSSETCRPAWSSGGRFLASIHKGIREEISIEDVALGAHVSAFGAQGQITWIDWSRPDSILFTYKEGTFSRPYRIRFRSRFAGN